MPNPVSYLKLVTTLVSEKVKSIYTQELNNEKIQESFMALTVDLSKKSLQANHHGISFFPLPDLTRVYVVSKPSLIEQIYNKRELAGKYGQAPLFNRLSSILGPNNLMSSVSPSRAELRAAILLRNEEMRHRKNAENRYELEELIEEFFESQSADINPNKKTLGQVMDALSRRVLLYTYFGKKSTEVFERLYQSELTRELMGSLFNIEPISQKEKLRLANLRQRIFDFAYTLLQQDNLKEELCASYSWLNRLICIHVLGNEDLHEALRSRGIVPHMALSGEQCEELVQFAKSRGDACPLSRVITDAVNESLFIPLLGFDATATLLVSSLKLSLQDPRIYKLVKQELEEQVAGNSYNFNHSAWDSSKEKPSYIEAVILEASRVLPPAPVIPEVVLEAMELENDGQLITLPAGSLLLMPLETIHKDSANFPDIHLSAEGESVFGKKLVTANDIFPERWLPVDRQNNPYNANWLSEIKGVNPVRLEKEKRLLTFKTGKNRCPGLRLALSEAMLVFKMLAKFDFQIAEEGGLAFPFVYSKPLQRFGGKGVLAVRKLVKPESVAETLVVEKPNPRVELPANFNEEKEIAKVSRLHP
ncbi:cytochrome P450 [Legionella birminghamensis]|nr:cytochrome P450 [Legionella birminghamensis]